ncbi:MAG TPA: SRPBCC domain-containing protein [Candidatus Saccharimonadales bacterium]|nr:SRPBCC domain-containing protein [Candidatus Saccharimonadales bacterium]
MTPIKEVEFERTYDAPVEKVWQAWTDPEELKQWWGPDNVTIPECEVELEVGGRFYIVMQATEAMGEYAGTRWPLEGRITELEPNKKLVYSANAWTEGDIEGTTLDQVQEITFAEDNGKTKMKLKVTLNKIGPKAGMAVEGMKWGFTQQFDKLDKYLGGKE